MEFSYAKMLIGKDYARFSGNTTINVLKLLVASRRNILLSTVINYRLRCWANANKKKGLLLFFVNLLFKAKSDIILSTTAEIGPGLLIYHGSGLVVGSSVRAGYNLTLEHGVTLGNRLPSKKKGASGCPIIGDNVFIGCGAKVLGQVRIGNNVIIGANAVVLNDVPDQSTAVGIPARILSQEKV